MSKVYDIGDTIAAISTPSGMGGIGIVRMSGPDAMEIADRMFVTRQGKTPVSFGSYTVHYGDVVCRIDGETQVVDEALMTVMKAPKSYTCEDVVEISCHGGSASVNTILQLTLQLGARLAGPGEFTKRAFLNGRIDLAQAEAVLDVIRARTSVGLSVSEHQLKGELTRRLEEIRVQIMDVYVQLEALVNFPEDGVEEAALKTIRDRMSEICQGIKHLLETADQGRILRDGAKIVLCGRPNVGKSSLLNVLLRQPRAIVSAIGGTTRDTIEESAQIEGVPFQIIDTAGILDPRDEIEEEAVKRSHLYMDEADLVLFLLDAGEALSGQDHYLAGKLQEQDVLVVLNKIDLKSRISDKDLESLLPGRDVQPVSALTQEGVETLRQKILQHVLHGKKMDSQDILLTNVRHIDALQKGLHSMESAGRQAGEGTPLEFISEHMKLAVQELDRITGREIDEDLVEQIFSQFCIGK